ncbi:hypothetical protein VIOR3934_04784 [Vibrio orientalis CIP 102891 = ATCC 33934]|uniref:Fe-S protein n=1 Tax=Vibrio orientalis CIP 102891 = ATCC 33934 TaxID=675816 RepID=F9SU55_VIBOR|nr:DUF1289 domain-containing protein [Vibrio orientalis]EGU49675.1 hypothetical protein VIOR3934_04784 [Vibrio orientalis CIP 102891 = ATCC 33934]
MNETSDEEPIYPSPCVRNCCLDGNDVCLGCFRTLEEILNWSHSSNVEKQAILAKCKERRAQNHRY